MNHREAAEALLRNAEDALTAACDPNVSAEHTRTAASLATATAVIAAVHALLDRAPAPPTRIVPAPRPHLRPVKGDLPA